MPAGFQAVEAAVEFDCETREATVEARVRFRAGADDGCPLFDLRQPVEGATLDGERLHPSELRHRDLGAGEAAAMRVVTRPVTAGTDHVLELRYRLGTPAAPGALPLGWTPDQPGVVFDLWMSDLVPGRYLEMWLPANLVHDRFPLSVDIRLTGTTVPHTVIANGVVDGAGHNELRVTYPAHFTALSPMLLVAPAGQVETRHHDDPLVAVESNTLAGSGVDLAAVEASVVEAVAANASRFGPYRHGDRFVAWVWSSARGMEYDGGTTSSFGALAHEVFHSWFGRGVKPASAADGWIDEALATWTTRGRLASQPLDLAMAEPVVLRPPHPYARHTAREAYLWGSRLCAGLAHLMGVDMLVAALARLYEVKAGDFLSTEELQHHLSEAASTDLTPWFDRLVHGRTPT